METRTVSTSTTPSTTTATTTPTTTTTSTNTNNQERIAVIKQEFLSPDQAYPIIDAILAGFNIGNFGLNATGVFPGMDSLITAIAIEMFCMSMATVVWTSEAFNIVSAYLSNITKEANLPFTGGNFTYLGLRAGPIAAGFVGASLIRSELPGDTSQPSPSPLNGTSVNHTQTEATDTRGTLTKVGVILIAVGLFTNRLLDAKYKTTTTETNKNTNTPDTNNHVAINIDDEQPTQHLSFNKSL